MCSFRLHDTDSVTKTPPFSTHSPDLALEELVTGRLAAVAVDEALGVEPLVALGVRRDRICRQKAMP